MLQLRNGYEIDINPMEDGEEFGNVLLSLEGEIFINGNYEDLKIIFHGCSGYAQ